jgi:Protein of unknown function (DUF742)
MIGDPNGSGRGRKGPVVRPYAITGGRARPRNQDLEVEALISSSARAETTRYLSYEKRTIIRLCQRVQSLAEISARLEMPIGVARVMVGDLADEGLVKVHRPSELIGSHPDLSLLERVLYGLRHI